jgi:hypothetical protein
VRPVELDALPVDDRQGHLRAIVARHEHLGGDIVRQGVIGAARLQLRVGDVELGLGTGDAIDLCRAGPRLQRQQHSGNAVVDTGELEASRQRQLHFDGSGAPARPDVKEP